MLERPVWPPRGEEGGKPSGRQESPWGGSIARSKPCLVEQSGQWPGFQETCMAQNLVWRLGEPRAFSHGKMLLSTGVPGPAGCLGPHPSSPLGPSVSICPTDSTSSFSKCVLGDSSEVDFLLHLLYPERRVASLFTVLDEVPC